ncbi:MAG: methyltransferase domain-containing protein, partial [candidate division Zixibacteria bacterium]|nr:methyltransferase domain-containing protein [candidate division Zixibacteria bacterium]
MINSDKSYFSLRSFYGILEPEEKSFIKEMLRMAGRKQPSVFEKYAHEYDLITNAVERVNYHQKEVDALITRFAPATVLDAGCANGLTSELLARRGVNTVGLDCSRRMIQAAREKCDSKNLPLSFRVGNFERLPKSMHSEFDLVVCLANSISGVSSVAGVRKTLKNFYAVLKPGGWLVMQMLNYSSMKEGTLFPI